MDLAFSLTAQVLRKTIKEKAEYLTLLSAEECQKILKICDEFEAAAAVSDAKILGMPNPREQNARKGSTPDVTEDAHAPEKPLAALATFLENFLHQLKDLPPGKRLVIPGGWAHDKGGHAIVYVIERATDGSYAMVVCNTGSGVEYHPPKMLADTYPKTKRCTAMKVPNIPSQRMVDEAVWFLMFKMKVISDKSHGPNMLYEVLLPHLAGDSVGPSELGTTQGSGRFESVQRSGTCFMRAVLAALRYLMKSDGFEQIQQKQLFLFVRQSFLDLVDLDLDRKNLDDFNDSDFRLIKLVSF